MSRRLDRSIVSAIERRRDVARRSAARIRQSLGEELRSARIEAGVGQASVGTAAEVSEAEVSRVERGAAPWLTIDELCRVAAPLGLEVSVKLYPARAGIVLL